MEYGLQHVQDNYERGNRLAGQRDSSILILNLKAIYKIKKKKKIFKNQRIMHHNKSKISKLLIVCLL